MIIGGEPLGTVALGELPAVASGTIYSRTLSDAIDVTELTGTARQRNRFIAEQLVLSEALIRSAMRGRVASDSVEVTELSNGLGFIAYGRVLSDAIGVTEALSRREAKLFRLLADNVELRDTLSVTIFNAIVYVRTLVDSVDVLDGLIRTAKLFRRFEESISAQDQLLRARHSNRQLLDSIAVSVATIRGMVHGRVVAESVELYESVFREVWLRRILTDAIDVDDDLASTITLTSSAIGFVLMQINVQGLMDVRTTQPITMGLGKNVN